MTDQLIVNGAHSVSTDVPGRTMNSIGVHHFVIDGPTAPNEEITSADVFLAGISSCAVHLLEQFAEGAGVALAKATADIEAIRHADDPSRFDRINLRLELRGPSQTEAEELVERFKGR